ncbi:MAG TPA: hypothetical protein VKY60_08985 [Burkholderiaceae bacterium]|nr:hypothetical protein [Burkholderiaceae bacterium]
MSLRTLSRSAALASLTAMVAACSWGGGDERAGYSDTSVVTRSDQCEANPRSCIYKGRYEAGERNYAELEARRLNEAQIERLRRAR